MNVNLIKKLILQNSKKYYKFLRNIINEDKLNAIKNVQHSTILKKYFLVPVTLDTNKLSRRWYCQENGPPAHPKKLPPLMNMPLMVWPSVLKSLKNLILTTFIIKPYFDNEFTLPDFVQGSKKAVEVISHRLSQCQDLEGLVIPDIIPTLQDRVSKLSLIQRELISIDAEDIYFSFPYQIGIMFTNENTEVQKRFVEITMVYHVLKGLATMRSQGEEPPLNLGMLPEYQDKLLICNYRFIREYTKGIEGDWTVNLLNHSNNASN
ncbi:hypothetical protein ABEB36_007182 [Hypothenemus hampei]|uniref:Uncharacterized protein n=1 Tax=Hypothenemus hampei TaxID=57062 RepID=A0ABD1ET63_HYPHA